MNEEYEAWGRRILAVHEAAHAHSAASSDNGGEVFKDVRLMKSWWSGHTERGFVTVSGHIDWEDNEIVRPYLRTFLVSFPAEERWIKEHPHDRYVWNHNTSTAGDYADFEELSRGTGFSLATMMADAEQFVDAHWDAIVETAILLDDRGRLSGSQVG